MKGKLIKRSLLVFMALVLAMSFLPVTAPSAHANDLYVGSGGYTTIAAAISAANGGDVITVADGTYFQVGVLSFDGKNITLQSENGPDDCRNDCL